MMKKEQIKEETKKNSDVKKIYEEVLAGSGSAKSGNVGKIRGIMREMLEVGQEESIGNIRKVAEKVLGIEVEWSVVEYSARKGNGGEFLVRESNGRKVVKRIK